MKKDRIEKELKVFRSLGRSLRLSLAVLVLCFCLCLPKPAAACEQVATAMQALSQLWQQDVQDINAFLSQEGSYNWEILSTSFDNMSKAQLLYAKNVETALNQFATELGAPTAGLKSMAMELHVSQVDQTYRLGQLEDAQLMAEEESRKENLINDAQTRYAPSFLACDIDTTGPGLNRAYQISRALNRTLAEDDQPRRENAVGNWPAINPSGTWEALPATSANANGKGEDLQASWQEYIAKYCDNTMGDLGCTTPGLDAGRHKDIGALLWGPQLTLDPTNQENIRVMQANLRFIIDPLAPDVIPQTVVPKPGQNMDEAAEGRRAILERRAEMAYVNAIYNVLGAMLSERIGGSQVDVSLMRANAGIPQVDTTPFEANTPPSTPPQPVPNSFGASYREVSEAMTRDRFNDPQYLVKMLSNPEQVARERNTLSALRLQTMNDIYRRQEEMLFMEAAGYGRDLNKQIPRAETARTPFISPTALPPGAPPTP